MSPINQVKNLPIDLIIQQNRKLKIKTGNNRIHCNVYRGERRLPMCLVLYKLRRLSTQ